MVGFFLSLSSFFYHILTLRLSCAHRRLHLFRFNIFVFWCDIPLQWIMTDFLWKRNRLCAIEWALRHEFRSSKRKKKSVWVREGNLPRMSEWKCCVNSWLYIWSGSKNIFATFALNWKFFLASPENSLTFNFLPCTFDTHNNKKRYNKQQSERGENMTTTKKWTQTT